MSTRQFSKHTVSTTQPMGGQAGDEWWDPSANRYYKYVLSSGVSPQWVEIAQPSLIASNANTWTSIQKFTTDVVHGVGDGTAAPLGVVIRGPSASGTNISGGALTFSGGTGTGSGVGGDLIFQTAPAGSSGSTANALSDRVRITAAGNLVIGSGENTPTTAGGIVRAPSVLTFSRFMGYIGNSSNSGTTITSSSNILTVVSVLNATTITVGQLITAQGVGASPVEANTYIISQLDGDTGSTGRYIVSVSQSVPQNGFMVGNASRAGGNLIIAGGQGTGSGTNGGYIDFQTTGSGFNVYGISNSALLTKLRITSGTGDIIIGTGEATAAPLGLVVRGPSGSGTDIAGGAITFAGGASTGAGAGGDIVFQTTPASGSSSTANSYVERMRLTGAGVLNISNTDIALDKSIVTQTVSYSSSVAYGYNASPVSPGQSTYTLPFTVTAGTNRCLILYFFGNEGGQVSIATPPTFSRNNVATNMTQLSQNSGSPVSSVWYLVSPDVGTSNIFVTMSTTSYCGFAIEQWNNVNQNTPCSGPQINNKTNAQNFTSVTISTTPTTSVVCAVVNGWNNTPTPTSGENQTSTWTSPNQESWMGRGYRVVPSSSSQTMSYTWSSTTNSGSIIGFSINGSSAASPVQIGTTTSAFNITFGSASSITLPTSSQALTFASNLLNFDTTNSRIGIGTITPAYKLESYGSIATRPAATNDALVFSGRAGGASSYSVTFTPTTLSANQTITVPNETGTLLTTASTIPGSASGSGARTFAFMGA